MDFWNVFVCFVSLFCIIMGIIVHYGKHNEFIFRFHVLTDEQKGKISRLYQCLLFGISFLWLGGLFVLHYYNIYHYSDRYFSIVMAFFCFSSVFWGLYNSWLIEKANYKRYNENRRVATKKR